MVESHHTRGKKSLNQPERSAINIDESSSIPSVKDMDLDVASLAALHLPPEERINQVVDNYKVRKPISWK